MFLLMHNIAHELMLPAICAGQTHAASYISPPPLSPAHAGHAERAPRQSTFPAPVTAAPAPPTGQGASFLRPVACTDTGVPQLRASLCVKRLATRVARFVHDALAIPARVVHYAMVSAHPTSLTEMRYYFRRVNPRTANLRLRLRTHAIRRIAQSLKISAAKALSSSGFFASDLCTL